MERGLFPALWLGIMCGGEGWGELAVKASVRGMREGWGGRGWTILTNVTDASDAKFRVCDPSRLSQSRRFQRWRVFAFRVLKMISRWGHEDAKTFASAQLCLESYQGNDIKHVRLEAKEKTISAYAMMHTGSRMIRKKTIGDQQCNLKK